LERFGVNQVQTKSYNGESLNPNYSFANNVFKRQHIEILYL